MTTRARHARGHDETDWVLRHVTSLRTVVAECAPTLRSGRRTMRPHHLVDPVTSEARPPC